MTDLAATLARAVQLQQAGDLAGADTLYQQVLASEPRQPDALHLLGVLAHQQGDHQRARQLVAAAVAERPHDATILHNLGCLLKDQRRFPEAIIAFQRAVACRPNFSAAWYNLAAIQLEQGQFHEASLGYHRAIRHDPADPESWNNLASCYKELGRIDEAVASLQAALRLQPDHRLARFNLGVVQRVQGDHSAALETYRQLLALDATVPEWHLYTGMVLLLLGRFAEGWPEYEWRLHVADYATDLSPYQKPRWRGESLRGRTILLHAEQGLGDSIQFIRYALLLKQHGARVVFRSPPALVPLMRSCRGIDLLVSDRDPLPEYDCYVPLLSLPGLCGTNMNSIPAPIPYLSPQPELVEYWRARLPAKRGMRVGINWRGSQMPGPWQHRDVPLEQFARLAQQPGIELLCLQKGEALRSDALLRQQIPMLDLGDALDSTHGPFMDSAALMQQLDLVITSDTSVAHLAGALGVPVWVVLPIVSDWRWLLEREDTPWYPSMRLFRQQRWGDWSPVFDRVLAALTAWQQSPHLR
jgi:Tfp pilus assembly protein PilF